MQPDCRQEKGKAPWPPSKVLPPMNEWKRLTRAGPNGFFLIVLTLAWWADTIAKTLAPYYAEFKIAVDDVLWVLSEIIREPPVHQLSVKRARPESANKENDEKPRPKRYVVMYDSWL